MEHLEQAGLELIGTRTPPRSPSGCWARQPTCARRRCRATTAALIESYVAVKAPAREAAGRTQRAHARPQHRHLRRPRCLPAPPRSACAKAGVDLGGRGVLRRVRPQPRILHGLRVRGDRAGARPQEPGRRRRPLRRPARRCRRAGAGAGRRRVASTPSGCWRCCRERRHEHGTNGNGTTAS